MGCGKTTLRMKYSNQSKRTPIVIGSPGKDGSDISVLRRIDDLKRVVIQAHKDHELIIIETIRFCRTWIPWLGNAVILVYFRLSPEESWERLVGREKEVRETRKLAWIKHSNMIERAVKSSPNSWKKIIVDDDSKTDEVIKEINAYIHTQL